MSPTHVLAVLSSLCAVEGFVLLAKAPTNKHPHGGVVGNHRIRTSMLVPQIPSPPTWTTCLLMTVVLLRTASRSRSRSIRPRTVMMGGGYSGSGDQADLDNHANQCNPNNDEYNGYQDNDDSDDSDDNAYSQADLDNHANQLNPNNDLYQGDDDDVDDD
mmetsp:Transcript_7323/g.15206  ORF Transcript_7323/g.15206 Transcript_7323/m.15206 type:complete len:159 (+) Transcript_7323:76-552(+)